MEYYRAQPRIKSTSASWHALQSRGHSQIQLVWSRLRPDPGTTLPSRPPQTGKPHLPTQFTLLSTPKSAPPAASRPASVSPSSLLYQSFHLSHRHQHHHQMDAALAKIFVSNAQWTKAVNSAEPGFFELSAKGQSPKVRSRLPFFPPRAAMVPSWVEILTHFRIHTDRSSGSDAPTLASQKVS